MGISKQWRQRRDDRRETSRTRTFEEEKAEDLDKACFKKNEYAVQSTEIYAGNRDVLFNGKNS